jgi:hypothetical protein
MAMKNKTYQFTTSTTAGNPNYNNLNKVPEQGSIKLIIDDKLGEEGLGIKLNLSSQQIRMLGYLLGSQASEHRNVFTTLEVLIEIVETAKETIISKKIIDNEVKKLKNSYKSLSVKEKEKYSSIEEYIEQNLTNSSIELQEKIKKAILSKNIDEKIFEN